jgi:hypothetical protein
MRLNGRERGHSLEDGKSISGGIVTMRNGSAGARAGKRYWMFVVAGEVVIMDGGRDGGRDGAGVGGSARGREVDHERRHCNGRERLAKRGGHPLMASRRDRLERSL